MLKASMSGWLRILPQSWLAYGDSGSFTSQHYAFLVSEDEFDAIFARLQERSAEYWYDPGAPAGGGDQPP